MGMTVVIGSTNVGFQKAVVLSVPRRETGVPRDVSSCIFTIEVDDDGKNRKVRVQCNEETADSAIEVVSKGDIGDFYGVYDASTNTVVVTNIYLNDHV